MVTTSRYLVQSKKDEYPPVIGVTISESLGKWIAGNLELCDLKEIIQPVTQCPKGIKGKGGISFFWEPRNVNNFVFYLDKPFQPTLALVDLVALKMRLKLEIYSHYHML